MQPIVVPKLITERLLLKAITSADIPNYKKYFVDYEVIKHLSSSVPWPYPEDGVEQYLKLSIFPAQGINRWDWGLFLKEEPQELIGGIGLWRPGVPENRGFWLARKLWGQGLMVEAAQAVNEHAFNELGFEKLIFSNALGNIKSRRIKEKTGAKFLSNRPAKFVDPTIIEAETWEMTKEEWKKLQK